jgi:hypothetical protein
VLILQDTATPQSSEQAKSRRQAKSCGLCGQAEDDVTIYDHKGNVTLKIPTQTLACAFEDLNGEFRTRMVHTDCLGFPGVSDEKIEAMPDWYCKLHMSEGRKKTGAVEETAEAVQKKPKSGLFSKKTKQVQDSDSGKSSKAGSSKKTGKGKSK